MTRHIARFVCGCLLLLSSGLGFSATPRAGPREGDRAAIALLSPADHATVSGGSLRVQALVAAVKPHARESFAFAGERIAGLNQGRIERVDVMFDNVIVAARDTREWGPQFLVDVTVDVSAASALDHLVRVIAYPSDFTRAPVLETVTVRIDRSGPAASPSFVERAWTPRPFAALSVSKEKQEISPGSKAHKLNFMTDVLVPPGTSAASLIGERTVIVIGSQRLVVLPHEWRCERPRESCRVDRPGKPPLDRIEMKLEKGNRLRLALKGGKVDLDGTRLFLQVGALWGGVDLATGELIVQLQPRLDAARSVAASIGASGGQLSLIDGAGVIIELDVPPGALAADTVIRMTPLLDSALADWSTARHPGIRFEPAGLVFATPARLTLRFDGTGVTVRPSDLIWLVTSPLTGVPLIGGADPAASTITALVPHFSTAQAASPNAALLDLAAIVANLPAPSDMTFADLHQVALLAGMAMERLQSGDPACANNYCQGFIDALQPAVLAALPHLAQDACQQATLAPSLALFSTIGTLRATAQTFNGDGSIGRDCQGLILRALIDLAVLDVEAVVSSADFPVVQQKLAAVLALAALAASDSWDEEDAYARSRHASALQNAVAEAPETTNVATLTYLSKLALYAAFTTVEDGQADALAKTKEVMEAWLEEGQELCGDDQDAGTARLRELRTLVVDARFAEAAGPSLPGHVDDAIASCGITIELLPPSPVTLPPGAFVDFSATVTGTSDASVTWSVVGVGSIDSNGRYSALGTAGTAEVRATSVANPSAVARAQVEVGIHITVLPETAILRIGQTLELSVTVLGTENTAVVWSATGPGSISATGVLTGGPGTGAVHVRATSVADSRRFAEATVLVAPTPPFGATALGGEFVSFVRAQTWLGYDEDADDDIRDKCHRWLADDQPLPFKLNCDARSSLIVEQSSTSVDFIVRQQVVAQSADPNSQQSRADFMVTFNLEFLKAGTLKVIVDPLLTADWSGIVVDLATNTYLSDPAESTVRITGPSVMSLSVSLEVSNDRRSGALLYEGRAFRLEFIPD